MQPTRLMLVQVIMMMVLPGPALAGNLTAFQDGGDRATAVLDEPHPEDIINLSLPAECYILNATMRVRSAIPEKTMAAYPENVSILLNDTPIWSFCGTGYGGLGGQDRLMNQCFNITLNSGKDGGRCDGAIRLMQTAVIESATADIACSGPGGVGELLNFTDGYQDDWYGYTVAGGGDVNGDGFDDILVCAIGNKSNEVAVVSLYLGNRTPDNTPDLKFLGADACDTFGGAMLDDCDLNGDGYDDIVISARTNTSSYLGDEYMGNRGGVVSIYFGGKEIFTRPSLLLSESRSVGGYDQFGCRIASGDFNGDGWDDLIAGCPYNNTMGSYSGTAYLFFGGPSLDAKADVIFIGQGYQAMFGGNVACAGDVNHDGCDDILVGAWGDNNTIGKSFVFFGGKNMNPYITAPDVTMVGGAQGDYFGGGISGAGDMNGDGYDDIIVGAPLNSTKGFETGSAYIFFGGKNMDGYPDVVLEPKSPFGRFGCPMKGIGDVNKDGCDDVIVGSIYADATGAAYVYYGNALKENMPFGITQATPLSYETPAAI